MTTRQLDFDLRHPLVVAGDTPDDGTPLLDFEWSTLDNDEKVTICLNLSLNEYVKLASALDVGRDIAYGEDTNLIWWIWTRAFLGACGMSCEDIVDCIENDPDVLAALLAQLAANGYTPNTSVADAEEIKPMNSARLAEDLLPESFDCSSPEKNMAIARSIVRELNESAEDLFDSIEITTNPVEAASIVSDGIPVAGTVNNLAEFADWLVQTAREMYQAAYNQTTEDEIACAIFCHLENDCTLSLDELIDIYSQFEFEPPPTPDNFQALIDWTLTITGLLAADAVAAVHSMMLYIMRFGNPIMGTSFSDLSNIIKAAAELNDYSYEDCSDCPPDETPTNFWRIYWNFALSPQGWITANNTTNYVGKAGFENTPGATANVGASIDMDDIGLDSTGANWQAVAMYAQIWAVDTENSGSNDFYAGGVYSGANQAGTFNNYGNATLGIRSWGVAYHGANNELVPRPVRSLRSTRVAAGGAASKSAHWVRVTGIVLVGLPDVNGNKPAGANWWLDALPTDPEDYFD